jgi:hypothetical protein
MDRFTETLYDVMGLSRDAGPHDINRAWNRHRSRMRDEAAPPDPRRDALMRHAYETLSDPYRRATYDQSLRRESPVLRASARAPIRAATIAAAVIAALAGGAYWVWREQQPLANAAALPTRPVEEIRDAVVRAVGRVQLVGLDGNASLQGVAFTIEEGVMATSCEGLTPVAEPLVIAPNRQWPARVTAFDARGICRLDVHGGAAFPLPLSGEVPRPGARVYAVDVTPSGEAQLREGKVLRVGGGDIAAIETSMPVTPANAGRPLLDADGRVVAVGIVAGNASGRYVPIPKRWLARDPVPEVSHARRREADESAPAEAPANSRSPVNISPEREKRLNDAFRPPPKVPDDL